MIEECEKEDESEGNTQSDIFSTARQCSIIELKILPMTHLLLTRESQLLLSHTSSKRSPLHNGVLFAILRELKSWRICHTSVTRLLHLPVCEWAREKQIAKVICTFCNIDAKNGKTFVLTVLFSQKSLFCVPAHSHNQSHEGGRKQMCSWFNTLVSPRGEATSVHLGWSFLEITAMTMR